MLEQSLQADAPTVPASRPARLPSSSPSSRPTSAAPVPRGSRRWRWLGVPLVALSLAACGGDDYDPYYDDPYCNPAYYPAISVRFVDATSLRRITIGALGTISNGRVTEEMTSPEPGYAVDGRTSVLEGGFGWTGVFDVSVATRAGERYDWTAIHVTGDRCQVYTVELEAPVHFPDP